MHASESGRIPLTSIPVRPYESPVGSTTLTEVVGFYEAAMKKLKIFYLSYLCFENGFGYGVVTLPLVMLRTSGHIESTPCGCVSISSRIYISSKRNRLSFGLKTRCHVLEILVAHIYCLITLPAVRRTVLVADNGLRLFELF